MMIHRSLLLALFMRREPWHWRATIWRKLPNGRIVRFINWNWKNPKGENTK